jgi:dTMP kinase
MNVQPRFIVFEGIDASGTTTQALMLAEALQGRGIDAVRTKEPCYGTPIGDMIGEYLAKRKEFSPHTLALLFAADRLEHTAVIREWLAAGKTVVSDRYLHSNMAYQGAHGIDVQWIRALERFAISPDLVVFLRISPEHAARRRLDKDRNEENLAYQAKVADAYEKIREEGWLVMDATLSKETIHEGVMKRIFP